MGVIIGMANLFLVAIIGMVWAIFAEDGYRWVGAVVAFVFIMLGFGVLLASTYNSVPTKSIAVITSYGKVVGKPLGPGVHWLAPWKQLHIIDETVQTTTFEVHGDNQGGLPVRIGGQQEARLDITIQWRVQDAAADGLFQSFANQGRDLMSEIRNALVIRELQAAANAQMGDYNPIADVATNNKAGLSQFSTFSGKIADAMKHDIGRRINIVKVILPLAHYAPETQQRLEQIQQQYAETAIAQQQEITNKAQAKANEALAKSVNQNPGVLEAQCLQIVATAIKNNYGGLPAGFSCTGSSPGLLVSGNRS
jgi:regulator of protease activity HflC (stomatin/prohibitin superfamily)